MSKAISKRLAKLVTLAQKMEADYNEGRYMAAFDGIEKISDLIEKIEVPMGNEKIDTRAIIEEAERSPKFGGLALKIFS